MGSLSPLQGIFLTKESNQGLLHCRQILYQLSYQGSPRVVSFWGHWEWVHSRPRSWFWWLSPILDFYRHQFSLWRGYMHHLCLLMTFFPKCLQFFYKDNKSYWFRTHSSLIRPHFNIIPSFVVQSLSCVRLFATPWTAACQASLSFNISQSLLKLMSIESVIPSNHLIFCCPLLLLPSQHQGLFQWIGFWNQVGKVLELQLHQSFQWIFTVGFLQDWLVWSPFSPRDSQELSNTTVWKHQFFGTQPSLCSNSPQSYFQIMLHFKILSSWNFSIYFWRTQLNSLKGEKSRKIGC